MTVLLDGNVLVALVLSGHVHGDAARRWRGTGAAALPHSTQVSPRYMPTSPISCLSLGNRHHLTTSGSLAPD